MSTPRRIDPWYTEEYTKAREAEIDALIAKGEHPFLPWIEGEEEKKEKLRKATKKDIIASRRSMLKEMEELGPEGYVMNSIKELRQQILRLKNPTKEDLYKYTDAYFNDHIKIHEETLLFFEDLLGDKEKLQIAFDNLKERLQKIEEEAINNETLQIPKTCYPGEFIASKDKISNMLFNDELTTGKHPIRMERLGSKKELTAVVSIGYEELQGMQISRNFTPYDWQVHNSIISLYVDGGNDYITPLMIYRTMTGNPEAKLTDNITKAISESITKCSITRIQIDATKEAEAWGMDQMIYEGNLIYTEKVAGKHNGKISEWIHILRRPILYDYANSKNQVARMDIKLLNTPINKNKENIELQSYLQKRVLDMKGSRLSRNILYETVYKRLDINSERYKKLRDKQNKVRDNIKTILDYWKEENFIADYKENTGPRNAKISITIILD